MSYHGAVLRPAGLVNLGVSFVFVVSFGAATLGCGGGAALAPTDSGSGNDAVTHDAVDGAAGDGAATEGGIVPGATGLLAGNGAPIPDPPLKDPCTVLGVASKSCTANDACPALTCDCGGVPQTIDLTGTCALSGACLTGVSCPDFCATPNFATDRLFVCLIDGVCDTDADCSASKPRCLRSLDGSRGHCVFLTPGSDCYRDADCATSACVAMRGGERWCQDKQPGSSCNRDDQCDAPANGIGKSACVLRPGEFQGVCTDASERAPCLASTDCLPGYGCAKLIAGEFGQCTSRGKGAPCAVDTDCAEQGLCVSPSGTWGTCDTGEAGATCTDGDDCHSGFCFATKCTDGTTGSPCVLDTECATHMCASAGPGALMPGQCTDGKLGSPCWGVLSTQCAAGLHCTGVAGSETCAAQ